MAAAVSICLLCRVQALYCFVMKLRLLHNVSAYVSLLIMTAPPPLRTRFPSPGLASIEWQGQSSCTPQLV